MREVKSNPKAFLRYFKISDDNGKAKALNLFFKSAFTEESDCLPDLNLNVKSSIGHVYFVTDKTKEKLADLSSYNLPGADEFHPRILNELSNELSLYLSLILSKSFSKGEQTQDQKHPITITSKRRTRVCQ